MRKCLGLVDPAPVLFSGILLERSENQERS